MEPSAITPRRVLLAPSGSDGDVFPMVEFGKRLRARGHSVRAASVPSAKPHFEAAGIPFVEGGLDLRTFLTGKNFGSLSLKARFDEVRFLRKDVARQFAALGVAVREADAVISGGYNYSAGSTAAMRGIPHVHVFHVPNVYPTDTHPCMNVPWQSLPAWANRASWRVNGLIQNLMFRGLMNRERRRISLPPIADVWETFTANSMLAIPDALHAAPRDLGPARPQTSYWFTSEEPALPPELEAFLDRGPRPFYFGIGSMPSAEKAKTIATISAVCRAFGTRAIVSKGWAGFDAPADPAIFLVGKVSHARLFERVEFVVHHGGPGTVSTAARAGAVQILIPHVFDQFYWGRRVAELGLGPKPIPLAGFSAGALGERIREIRAVSAYAARTAAMRERLRGADGIADFFRPEFQKRWGLAL